MLKPKLWIINIHPTSTSLQHTGYLFNRILDFTVISIQLLGECNIYYREECWIYKNTTRVMINIYIYIYSFPLRGYAAMIIMLPLAFKRKPSLFACFSAENDLSWSESHDRMEKFCGEIKNNNWGCTEQIPLLMMCVAVCNCLQRAHTLSKSLPWMRWRRLKIHVKLSFVSYLNSWRLMVWYFSNQELDFFQHERLIFLKSATLLRGTMLARAK